MMQINSPIFFLAILIVFTVMVPTAEAKSVSANIAPGVQLAQYGNTNGVHGWRRALANLNVTVIYAATLSDAITNLVYNDGDTVEVGSQIKITPKAHEYTDIAWFGAGYAWDSPYGDWGTSAPTISCLPQDYVESSEGNSTAYIPLLVAAPTKTITTSENLTCGEVAIDGSKTCIVNAAGSITASVDFAPTAGTFYYRYKRLEGNTECRGNNIPLYTHTSNSGSEATGVSSSAYILPVPAESISFNISAVSPVCDNILNIGCVPATDDSESSDQPTAHLNATPTSIIINDSATLSWTSTNATSCTGTGFSTGGAISGSVSTGPLSSNTNNYLVTCTNGSTSAIDTTTVTVGETATIDIEALPSRVHTGNSVNLTWTSSGCSTVNITKNNVAFSSLLQGTNVPSGPITTQTTFRAICDAGTAADHVIVNLVPRFREF